MNVPPYNFGEILQEIIAKGYRPLLAQPERYRYLQMKDYQHLDSIGVHFQLNLPSLLGYYGESAQKKAKDLLRNGWYKRLGSDCHRLHALREQFDREVLTSDINEQLRQLL